MSRRLEWTCLAVILLAGFGLRLWGATRAGLTSDESVIWAFAREISLSSPASLATRSADHPPLGADLARASACAFGDSDLGLRMLHLLMGSLTVLLVYRIARGLWGGPAALVAAALLAVDQFHASWSRLILEEGPLLFFIALALWLATLALRTSASWAMLGAGAALGGAYLVKETAALLIPGLALGLLASASGRALLRSRGALLGLLAASGIVGLDLGWSMHHQADSYWLRDAEILGRSWGLTAKALSLYLGELFRVAFGPEALDAEYEAGSAFTVFWPFGLVYLLAVGWASFRARDPGVRLLLAVFWVPVAVVSVVEAAAPFDPFWWASASLVPAVLLGGRFLATLAVTRTRLLVAITLVLGVGLARDLPMLGREGRAAPRLSRREWALAMAEDGQQRLAEGDRRAAQAQARAGLLMDPQCAPARALLEALSRSER